MYLKKVKAKSSVYLKFVETVWDKTQKKRIQKTILNLGNLDSLMQNGLPNIVATLADLVREELSKKGSSELAKYPDLQDIKKMSEGEIFNYGHIAYRKLWNTMGVGALLKSVVSRTKTEFNFAEAVYDMTVNQLMKPSSKLQLFSRRKNYLNLS